MAGANPLLWRERAAVADMHCRLAAKILNQLTQADRATADSLLSGLGKALECMRSAAMALEESRAEVERLYRRQPTARGAVVKHPAQPMLNSIAALASTPDPMYCEWQRGDEIGLGQKDGKLAPIYAWTIGCKGHKGYFTEHPEICHCNKRVRISSLPKPAGWPTS